MKWLIVVLSSRAGSLMKPGYLEMVGIKWEVECIGWCIICNMSEDEVSSSGSGLVGLV